jgi:AcrR family transcriptional regulator
MASGKLTAVYEAYLKKRPKQSRSRALVQVVLAAAEDILAKSHEEDEVTVQAVADRAGVGIGSLYDYFRDRDSLLAGVAAKLTEDNLAALEVVLLETRPLSLDAAVARFLDFAFDTYVKDARTPRAVLRIAHRFDLMPLLARSQAAFAETLAAELRARPDVRVDDHDVAAYTVTNMTMGVIGTIVWRAEREPDVATLRRALARACTLYLSDGQAP